MSSRWAAAADDVPKSMVERYASRYPVEAAGRGARGAAAAGARRAHEGDSQGGYDPKNPKPNLDNYDSKRVKIPERKAAPPESSAGSGEDAAQARPERRSPGRRRSSLAASEAIRCRRRLR